jgi:single-strand DNA-binding protein
MANLNFNNVIIAGRLTADPELKSTQSGISVCTFTVAVNRRTKKDEEQKADFFNVTVWREQAEFVTRYFTKGSSIFVTGELQNRTWEKDGQKHYATEILARDIRFVDGKNDAQGASSSSVASATQAVTYIPESYQTAFTQPSETLADDDDLPF